MRVCMRVGAWVRSHFAEVSKIAQDAHEAGTQAPGRPLKREQHHRTQATGAGAMERSDQSDHRKPRSTSAPSARV